MDFNISDYVNEDGSFNDDGPGLNTLAGEIHKESKSYGDVKNFPAFVKAAFDSHALVGKKLENVIQRPEENATDEQKADFRKLLLKELGARESADQFNIQLPDIPENMRTPQDDEILDKWIGRFVEMGMPEELAQGLINHFVADNIQSHNDYVKAENEAFERSKNEFKARHKGDDEIKDLRIAHDALMRFGSDDIVKDGQTIKGLKTLLEEDKIYDTPTDYEKWRKLGLKPDQLEVWANIGNRMQSGLSLKDEDTGNQGEKQTTKELGRTMYTHPTSKELVESGS